MIREGRVDGHRLLERALVPTARVSRVPVVHLERALAAGDHDVARVDDDDVLAGVEVRGELGAVLAAQDARDVRREPAEASALRVDEKPALLDSAGLA